VLQVFDQALYEEPVHLATRVLLLALLRLGARNLLDAVPEQPILEALCSGLWGRRFGHQRLPRTGVFLRESSSPDPNTCSNVLP
jgi:hypothetical protein